MSFKFAIPSRWHARVGSLRCGVAAVFLACLKANAQEIPASPAPATNQSAGTNSAPQSPVDTSHLLAASNTNIALSSNQVLGPEGVGDFQSRLESAKQLRLMRQPAIAEPMLTDLLKEGTPDSVQQSALLELATIAQDQNNLVRAEQIYSQFIGRWSNDRRIPEIFLHQGQLFRQMGLNSLALAKFYSVMTAALALKNDQLDYYQKLVLDAQMEIAETHYQAGHFADAADFFSRLMKQNNPAMNRPEIQFRLIRSLHASANYAETSAQARDYLTRFPDSANQPEVRFCLALSLKELGQSNDSLQQVLALLREQKVQAKDHPEVWAYWQQRTGNEIGNQLYREGDYPKALDIYLSLEQLDHNFAWQLPVTYQIGMTYERLLQPQMAMQSYSNILSRQSELGTNASPGLKAIVDMASWRINFIKWQSKADNINRELADDPATQSASTKPAPSTTAIP